MEDQMQRSVASDTSRTSRHVACSRVAKAVPKGRVCVMAANYRETDAQVALAPWPMSYLETMMSRFVGGAGVSPVELIARLPYRQVPLTEDTWDLFAVA